MTSSAEIREPTFVVDREWLEHMEWESPELNAPYMQSEAEFAQNPNRGLRSEAAHMHQAVHEPEVLFLFEVSQPLRQKTIQKNLGLHLGQRMDMGIIYQEAGSQMGQVTIVDMQSLPARVQTSWHRSTSLRRTAETLATLDEAAHTIAEIRKTVKPKRYVRSGRAEIASHLKNYGYNFGARPATIEKRKKRVNQKETQKEEMLAREAILYILTEDAIPF